MNSDTDLYELVAGVYQLLRDELIELDCISSNERLTTVIISKPSEKVCMHSSRQQTIIHDQNLNLPAIIGVK